MAYQQSRLLSVRKYWAILQEKADEVTRHPLLWRLFRKSLKELYTSETTLAQKIVLTPLNNEFKLKKGLEILIAVVFCKECVLPVQ